MTAITRLRAALEKARSSLPLSSVTFTARPELPDSAFGPTAHVILAADDESIVADVPVGVHAALIVAAVNALPALLAVAEAAREHVAAHYARTQAGPRGAGVAEIIDATGAPVLYLVKCGAVDPVAVARALVGERGR